MTITIPHTKMAIGEDLTHTAIADQLDELFQRAAPRLLRLTLLHQIAPDAAEDIVQETLLAAWRSLDHLRDEARFDAWLDGICRNICRRHQRHQGIVQAHETGWDAADEATENLADPATFDPAEELTRQDLAFLLDRALSYLTPENRALVERHYLAEIPQRELAAQLGLTLSALEARLHRARGQLLHILGNGLRADALALGLAVAPADVLGWRDTRIWCIFCGQQRMAGRFEPMPDGRINMRLYCHHCKLTEINSMGLVDLTTARSFQPAMKKVIDAAGRFFGEALANGGRSRCWICHQPSQLRSYHDASLPAPLDTQTWLASQCACVRTFITPVSVYAYLPQVHEFMFGAERILIGPEAQLEYAGQQATRFCLHSPDDGRLLYVFADANTLLPLEVVVE